MAAPPGRGGADGYCDLPDVRLELDPGKVRGGGGGFTVCFWLYLSSSARPSSVVLDNGRITEEGAHEQLLKNKGWYYEQYMRQQLKSREEVEA